ncbi:MAG: hypothetical protein M3O70_16475 [Actinomycetota bacterium]|nr:hypothetical protein [Actinomycetota bacterium]
MMSSIGGSDQSCGARWRDRVGERRSVTGGVSVAALVPPGVSVQVAVSSLEVGIQVLRADADIH